MANPSQFDRAAKSGCFMLWALACLVMYAMCASPSTSTTRVEDADGRPVLDEAGQMIFERTWKNELGDAVPFLLTSSVSLMFVVLAMRALVKGDPPDPKGKSPIDGVEL